MSLLARWGTIIVVGLALLLGGARVARAEPGEDRGALPQAAPLPLLDSAQVYQRHPFGGRVRPV